MPTTISTLTLRERHYSAVRALAALLVRVCRGGRCVEARYRWIRGLLESLPLATNEFALAVNRLNNGRRHALEGETGAALYELQMLLRSLVLCK